MGSDWFQRARARVQKFIDYLIEDVSLLTYVLSFGGVVLGAGVVYTLLSPAGHGMGHGTTAVEAPSLFDGIYFSIVTVSSLGYGDIQPLGFSKAIVCFEVLFGLAFMGIVVAKLTSRRLSYHVQRLFSADAQRRLDEFAVRFEELERESRTTIRTISKAYQPTPGQTVSRDSDKAQAGQLFQRLIEGLNAACATLADYLGREVQQTGYFDIAPVEAMQRLAKALDQGVFNIGQLIVGLFPETRMEILDQSNRDRISTIIKDLLKLCTITEGHAKDPKTRGCFVRLRQTCTMTFEPSFSTPTPSPEFAQPDQILVHTDEPEEPAQASTGKTG